VNRLALFEADTSHPRIRQTTLFGIVDMHRGFSTCIGGCRQPRERVEGRHTLDALEHSRERRIGGVDPPASDDNLDGPREQQTNPQNPTQGSRRPHMG
jgi:hypothetical protein